MAARLSGWHPMRKLRLSDHVSWHLLDAPEDRLTEEMLEQLDSLYNQIAKIVSEAIGEPVES